jgi:predicted secreted hydrolase
MMKPAGAFLFACLLLSCADRRESVAAHPSVAEALRSDNPAGYARALESRNFVFPADHGPHLDFRTEWWYFTGNLDSREGRRFGFQLTFFRSALAPDMPARTSNWATRHAYLAHFALTDADGARFHSFERWSRGAAGLAGATASPLRVWLHGWQAAATDSETFPLRLVADAGDTAIDLMLDRGKPPVLQGDRGLSQKSAEPGNASYYYSLTRMPARGTIRVAGRDFAVSGLAWMDREWSTSALGPDQVGWDWLALQLDDGTDLMLYRLRRGDGSADPASQGTVVDESGSSRRLTLREMSLTPRGRFAAPSGAVYPRSWQVRVPCEGLELTVRPVLANQELAVSFRYWEGAVDAAGTRRGRPIAGRGYLEMTGYADAGR